MSQQLEVTVNLTDDRVRFTGKAGKTLKSFAITIHPSGLGRGIRALNY